MSNNTKYGVSSLNSNIGSNNTAVGAYSSYSNLDGDKNTAIGSNSSFYNTTGSNNTALGAGSLCNNTTGSLNTAVGSSALEGQLPEQSVGNHNVAIGAQALYSNSGDFNTAIGTFAALSVTNGSNNTFLGANTTTDGLNTYTNSTAIGYNAEVTSSNQIMMGGDNGSGVYPNVVINGNGYLPTFDITSVTLTPDQIVPKSYIDAVAQGLSPRDACKCIANDDVTISPPLTNLSNFNTLYTIDGYPTQVNDRVLINNQTNQVKNGIYVVTSTGSSPPYSWVRSSDMAVGQDALGAFCFITNGDKYKSTNFIQSTTVSIVNPPSDYIVVETDVLYFVIYSSFSYLDGRGLQLYNNGTDTYIQVDNNLSFIDSLDSNPTTYPAWGGATGGSGTLTIGNNTTQTIIGPPTSGNPVQFPIGLTTSKDVTIHGINVGLGGASNPNNTSVGYLALASNTDTGSGNTNSNEAFGQGALYKNTSGRYNTAVGYYALEYNTTGNDNVAVGRIALNSNVTGTSNTAIGKSALQQNNSINGNNTAIGSIAGQNDLAGSYNTYLGSSTGQESGDPSIYTFSTAVGYNAAFNASNQIMLGGSNNFGVYPQVVAPGGITSTTGSFSNIITSQDSNINTLTVGLGGGNIINNTSVGYQALLSNTTGSNNTASGYNALSSNTTGSYNTAFGFQSLLGNIGGNYNTATGFEALYTNTTGSYNTAYGVDALTSNTTGGSNTATGVNALATNNGSYNTAYGVDALTSNTTGINNTASGFEVLKSNTTGIENTAYGVNALYSNTTGGYNTASGVFALYSNTTGSTNTASGKNALYNNISGSNNTACGDNALYNNANSFNTAFGQSSGQTLTFGANNTFLGYNSDVSLSSQTYNNSTAIGFNATITDSNQMMLGGDNGSGVYPNVVIPGNLNVSGYISTGGVYYFNTISAAQSVSGNVTIGIIPATPPTANINTFSSIGITTGPVTPSPGGFPPTTAVVMPAGAYGVYSVSMDINTNINSPPGTLAIPKIVSFKIIQTDSSGAKKSEVISETYIAEDSAIDANTTPISGLFQYTPGNGGNYFSFFVSNSTGLNFTLDGPSPYSTIQITKIA
jgi:hypothetical protein